MFSRSFSLTMKLLLGLLAFAALVSALLFGQAGFRTEPRSAEATSLNEIKKLLASDIEAGDGFGSGVAVSGDTAVVGAHQEDAGGSAAGAAYVYQRNQGGAGNWGEVKKLTASDAQLGDLFGISVAVSGDTAIVGAWFEDAGGTAAGAAYVFQRDEGGTDNWGEVKKLLASDAQALDFFGLSVAVSGDTAVVGANWEDGGAGDPLQDAGAAYVFQRNQGGADNWGEVKKLTASDAESADFFGYNVAVSVDTIVVGAERESAGGSLAGAAYVFQRNQGGADNWGEVKKLTASDAQALDNFGYSVAVSGDTAVVGAVLEDAGGSDAGAAYVFQQNQGGVDNWGEVKKLTASDAGVGANFGWSVAVSGDTAVVGAANSAAGAYVFRRDEGGADNWGELNKLTASDAEADDLYGSSVAVSGDTVVVGARLEDAGGYNAGAAYVFDLLQPKPTPTPTPTATPTATPTPEPGVDDKMTSIGKFQILVSPDFRALMAGYPGYDGISKLDSPDLYDPSTVVGRSLYHLDGDATDSGGASVGTASTIISDSDFSLLPGGFEGPAGSREVHTEIRSMNLTAMGGLVAVRAGTNAPGQPMSPGEVESQSGSGNPVDDFPADSFFNVFVEVDLPGVFDFPGGTVYNSDPLLVVNNDVTSLPPRVVYVHGNSSAVPVYFKSDNLPEWQAGDLFGWLALAGHGASFDNSPADVAEFDQIYENTVETSPLPMPDSDGGGAPDDLEIFESGDTGNPADDAGILALDSDVDGCTNAREMGPDAALGGLRDYLNPWDWYDVNQDGVIDLINDILGVIDHWQPNVGGAPPYDVAFDRGPTAGPNPWNMTAPDGVIDLINDILGVIDQFSPTGCT